MSCPGVPASPRHRSAGFSHPNLTLITLIPRKRDFFGKSGVAGAPWDELQVLKEPPSGKSGKCPRPGAFPSTRDLSPFPGGADHGGRAFPWRNPEGSVPAAVQGRRELQKFPGISHGKRLAWGGRGPALKELGIFPVDSGPKFPFPEGIREGKKGILVTTSLTQPDLPAGASRIPGLLRIVRARDRARG